MALYTKKWREANAKKRAAHKATQLAKIPSKPCEICSCSEAQKHHSDYNKPLEIIWLCQQHHSAWHRVFEAIGA